MLSRLTHKVKLKENEKKDKYLDLARELKKKNMKVTIIQIVIGAFGTVTKRIIKGTGGLENKRTSEDHPNYCITEISPEKSPGDLMTLAVTQIPVKYHQQI